ncbi:Predicted dehydrogenase [Chitinophaga terrae (ex Kim and Jung 2007)]|uniref:Predicted dehydrogenase n=1 Tax=Chitinophaga terrae (ex Kim and Jung 2007) TaxID=408074 RepID=A0A1H4EBX9_9BACT|nr:Gfo/Idh/MocA family oxidoreductase [Chitinophaga terrae (ex Kim and Jung 2007)]MDQ0105508.1 putative dehydrogenase [Chitinophaga terrae (ex Kim and Jung 2007)]GEP91549.1 oxidoreductase [Chitinophaga terrae (ex Kim and Jung 2007)]SEA82551.1 Predicted dehydrogenase [Chitinophaga terrae (ex Kim and Jung 2007)]
MENEKKFHGEGRRDFVKQTSLLAGGLLAMPILSKASFLTNKASGDVIKIALIGCGGRGTGAATQALSTKENVQLVAMADAFPDRLKDSYDNIKEALGDKANRVNVPESNKFVGFDAYKQAIALADVVILTTPPGFRPIHFEEAVKQGKHIFMEKPVATDPAGIKRVLDAAEIAKSKRLNVVVGLQRHYQDSYRELMKRFHDGIIGDVLSMQVWWNQGALWVKPRKPEYTEMEYQMRNWYYFNWLCGDHIVEQHIHNIDVGNWFMGKTPVTAVGVGGRAVRTGKEYGEIFDHHSVEYRYDNGVVMNAQCRHWKDAPSKVDEEIVGTKGRIFCDKAQIVDHKGKVLYQFDKKKERNPYQTEHDELFAAIAKGEYKFNDAARGAQATLTAIIGRLATYSGQVINWDVALNSGLDLQPKVYAFDAPPPVVPDASGNYAYAKPGVTKYFS